MNTQELNKKLFEEQIQLIKMNINNQDSNILEQQKQKITQIKEDISDILQAEKDNTARKEGLRQLRQLEKEKELEQFYNQEDVRLDDFDIFWEEFAFLKAMIEFNEKEDIQYPWSGFYISSLSSTHANISLIDNWETYNANFTFDIEGDFQDFLKSICVKKFTHTYDEERLESDYPYPGKHKAIMKLFGVIREYMNR